MDEPRICGFVIRHGDKDFESWQVELPDDVLDKLYDILIPYQNQGCSVRDCSDMKIEELF